MYLNWRKERVRFVSPVDVPPTRLAPAAGSLSLTLRRSTDSFSQFRGSVRDATDGRQELRVGASLIYAVEFIECSLTTSSGSYDTPVSEADAQLLSQALLSPECRLKRLFVWSTLSSVVLSFCHPSLSVSVCGSHGKTMIPHSFLAS